MIAFLFAVATGSLDTPRDWTMFRLAPSNNAVIRGSLQTQWTLKTKGAFSSSPAIAGGVLYIGNNAGALYAIDPASGKVKWTYQVSNPLMSAPVAFGNLVIVGEGNEESPAGSSPSHPIHVGTPPSALIALDRNTGKVVWRRNLQGSGMPMPAVVDGTLVQHNGGSYLMGLDPATGAVKYAINEHSFASMSAAQPVGAGTFTSTGVDANAVFLFRASDGATVWSYPLSGNGSGMGDCPSVTDGSRIYCNYMMPPSTAVPMQSERSAIMHAYAIDVRSGKRSWDVVLEGGVIPIRNESAIPLLARGSLYMGSNLSNYVHSLDPATGSSRWRFRAHGPVRGGIVESNGVLYFGDYAGYLWAVNANTGASIGQRRMHVPFNVGSPIVAGQTLIIGAKNGTLYALPLSYIRSGRD